jgi:hypothetical protein
MSVGGQRFALRLKQEDAATLTVASTGLGGLSCYANTGCHNLNEAVSKKALEFGGAGFSRLFVAKTSSHVFEVYASLGGCRKDEEQKERMR